METAADTSRTTRRHPHETGEVGPLGGRVRDRAPKTKLLTRKNLDRRRHAAKLFDQIATGIQQDLGGEQALSTIRRTLVEAFAGMAIAMHDTNARLLLGEDINIVEASQAVSTLVRLASRLGLDRVAKEIDGDDASLLSEYEAALNAEE
jgi:hypothetical protein